MSYAADDEIYPLAGWDSCAWDRALLGRDDIGRVGDDGDAVFFRPGRLLVDVEAAQDDRVRGLLRETACEPDDGDHCEVAEALGLVVFTAPGDTNVKLVEQLRSFVPGGAALDHVLVAGPARWHGDDLPLPIADPGDIPGSGNDGAGLTIAILDTGIDAKVPFPVRSGGGDGEIADEDHDDHRDPPAGHGTHLAGLVARTAPGATIVAHRVLKTVAGQASELEVAQALLSLGDVDLVNCSFSGTVLEDAPPLAVERALARLAAKTVVVACAGNTGTSRPQWPAASGRTIAVGAIGRSKDGRWLRTDFSSWGSWVDCCAPGVSVPSTFLHVERFSGFASWSGTSMSSPQVVASIAAVATRHDVDVPAAAQMLVGDPSRPRVNQIGAIVDPADLP